MKIKILSLLLLSLLFACEDENGTQEDEKNDEALIISMSFEFGNVTFEGNQGTIKAPENTDLENLVPTIVISDGATIDPASNTTTDFTEPVEYKVTSEDQKNTSYYTISVLIPVVNFTVLDCSNRSPENPTAELAPDAVISIYLDESGSKELIEELTTDANGEVLFHGYWDLEYYLLAEKNDAVNIIDGYIIGGIFQSESDIDSSPPQIQSSQIGDLKFIDVTGDGMVNENDKVDYARVWLYTADEINEITVYISDE
jgi:hypothetical protein